VLKRAQEKAEAIIAKKDQMKRDFLQRLRYLSNSAAAAEELFSSEDFRHQVIRQFETEESDQPPDEGDGDEGENDPYPQ